MLDVIVEPFLFLFMQQGFLILVSVSVPTAILSCFIVLKGWALIGDAISHSVLPGVAIAYMLGFSFALGGFLAGLLCALLTGFLTENSRLKEDTVMGLVFSIMFALGVILISKIETTVHLDHILFGDLLGLSWRDVFESIGLACLVLLLLGLFGRNLLLYIFDSVHASVAGLSNKLLHYGLLSILCVTVVGALKAVGMILVIAMLITPGAISYLLTRRFQSMVILSIFISIICSLSGLYLSFFFDSAPAPTIICVLSLVFIVTFATKSWRVSTNSRQNIVQRLAP